MPKISSYPKDIDILDADAWIGTDSSNRSTKQFTASAVADYLNINGKVLIGGQMLYKFVDASEPSVTGTMAGPSEATQFADITSLDLWVTDLSGQTVDEFLDYLVGTGILINQQNDIDTFGHYTLGSFTADPGGADFYTATLTLKGSNGYISAIAPNNLYSIISFVPRGGDSTETFAQTTLASSWSVTHTINKKPAVSVVLGYPTTDDVEVYPQITYTSDSVVTIDFAEAQKGYAYLN